MKLSIITICRNQPDIEDTCESVAAQIWRDFEWIVIDGASTDGTLDRLQRYRGEMDVLVSEKDAGIYNAMNKGVRAAKGEWLYFLNGGDSLFNAHTLEKIFSHKLDDVDVAYGDFVYLLENGAFKHVSYPDIRITKRYFRDNFLCHQAAIVRHALFAEYGLYDESYRAVADLEKWIVYTEHKRRFKKIPVVFACFKHGGLSHNPQTRNLCLEEIEKLKARHYPQERPEKVEDKAVKRKKDSYSRVFALMILRMIPALAIYEIAHHTKMKIFLFGIPVMKITRHVDGRKDWRLFGIPLLATFSMNDGDSEPEFTRHSRFPRSDQWGSCTK